MEADDRHDLELAMEGLDATPEAVRGIYQQWDAGLGSLTVSLLGSGLFVRDRAPEAPATAVQVTQVAGDCFQGNFGGGSQDVTYYPDDAGVTSWFVSRIGVGVRQ